MRAAKTPIQAVVFDVEGTLVDCANQVIESWRLTLQESGYEFSAGGLHRYSGMDTDDMLGVILPDPTKEEKDALKRAHDERYKRDYLPLVVAFPDVRFVLEGLRQAGFRLGIATTCSSDELSVYFDLTGIRELVGAIACGDDKCPGKPHPDLFKLVLGRLGARKSAIAVGDTPYDAIAAARAGIPTIGTLGGGFPISELEDSGCRAVIARLSELTKLLVPA